jgi:hypothetical protein
MDNFYQSCPPMMSDGRLFTDNRLATRRNEYVKYINNVVRDDVYRLFLQDNATKISDNEWSYHKKKNSCFQNKCVHVYPSRVYSPYFAQERKNHDAKPRPYILSKAPIVSAKEMSTCGNYPDYRLT